MNNSSENNVEEKKIAFLDLAVFEDGAAIRGGCLVTDEHTHPLEFRVSGAFRPTSLQKILYGDTLNEYISNDLIGLPILKVLENKPDLVLVRDAEFLKLRLRVDMPILWVRATVEGQYVLQALPGHDQEAEAGRDVLPQRLRGSNIMEPFSRIHSALEEAHNLKVGEGQ
ncbi:MAG: hypothetical protein E3J37_07140 [Anaerolineales bacterium]|nr:MAG: hypothetical protein E3J37_07140 [Anaerolineales bacterium]